MMYLAAILLGIIQGLTEFLPISSTAHLVLTERILNLSPDQFGLAFNVALHVGTAFAVLVYFWQTWWRLVINSFRNGLTRAQNVDRNILLALAIGTLPAGILGMVLNKTIEENFSTPLVIATSLLLGSAIFYVAEKVAKPQKDMDRLTYMDGFLIGCAQAVALLPGISRSGITISSGLLRNFDRETAARFAFLLSTPVIFGAAIVEFLKLMKHDTGQTDWSLFGIGMVSSLIVGYLTIVYFLRFMKNHSLRGFIWYRVGLAVVVLALMFSGLL